MLEIIIREATAPDLAALERCEQGVIRAERPYDSTLKPDVIHYYNIAAMIDAPHVHFLVAATPDQEIIGCGFARIETVAQYLRHERQAYLGLMYVDARYRGQGINGRIIDTLRRWCRAKDVRELRLDVYDGNAAAVRAYEKAGFVRHMVEMRVALDE